MPLESQAPGDRRTPCEGGSHPVELYVVHRLLADDRECRTAGTTIRSGYNTGDMRPPRKQASADHHYTHIHHEYSEGVSEEAALTHMPSDRRKH
jgi:hypothetical protein